MPNLMTSASGFYFETAEEYNTPKNCFRNSQTEDFEIEDFSPGKLTHHFGELTLVTCRPTFGDVLT